ncbi:MAG: VOC family protein [Chloroflexi bacterium]|nr:VOC family protein [Chloroflexota bacterium]
MNIQSLIVNVTSEDPARLGAFYRDVVGLPRHPLHEGALALGGAILSIGTHSDTAGSAREPSRVIIDLCVQDAAGETARLKAAGVPCLLEAFSYRCDHCGAAFSTFADPDGSYFQLIEYNPALAGVR